MDVFGNLNVFFQDVLQDLPCDEDARAYIIGIFGKYRNTEFDLSKESITLMFAQASYKSDFLSFQTVGDYLFFANTIFPESLNATARGYYYDIGRLSYYSCYRLINRQWRLYEMPADQFVPLSEEARTLLR